MEDFEIRIPQPGEHYEHHKGGRYEVLATARMSEKRDELVVVYRSLERGHVWVRPLGMWGEYVELPAATPGKPPTRVQRYRLCADSPPSTEVIPLSPEEATALDRELFELVPAECSAPLDERRCQHLRAATLPKHSTVRISTVPDAQNATSHRCRMQVELCVFCSAYCIGHMVDVFKAEPMLCAPTE